MKIKIKQTVKQSKKEVGEPANAQEANKNLDALKNSICAFKPFDNAEADAKNKLLSAVNTYGAKVLTRECEIHVTASAFVTDFSVQNVLVVKHKIYKTYTFAGGHADGNADLLQVALFETQEETGVLAVPLVSVPVALDVLPVPLHCKNGKAVSAHRHFSVTYALIADFKKAPQKNADENEDARWFLLPEFFLQCDEKHMMPVYEKCVRRITDYFNIKKNLLQKLPSLLVPWYRLNKRDLPWRGADAYGVLVSEIMLQQTRAETVKAYYARFMSELPNVQALAQCPDQKLYKLWEGLGYYSRAKNLRAAAQKIVAIYDGVVPSSITALRSLQGVGEYTAGAVASIAFGQKAAAIDGNALRVIGRYTESFFGTFDPVYRARLCADLSKVYPEGECGEFTQSIMDLGSKICLPKGRAKCLECPIKTDCLANKHATAALLPVRGAKLVRREECLTVFVVCCKGLLAVKKRGVGGLLSSLDELPNTAGFLSSAEAFDWLKKYGLVAEGAFTQSRAKHVFTHITWHMRVYKFEVIGLGKTDFVWANPADLAEKITLPTAFKRCLDA